MQIEIRPACSADLDAVAAIYDHIHTAQETGATYTGWVRSVYPTRATAEAALARSDLFVEVAEGKLVGAAILNQVQVDVYSQAAWQYPAAEDEIMVLHTLVIDPYVKGRGLGANFAAFYERYAREHGCRALRLDTNARNRNARSFYQKLGYQEVGILPCQFNGIPDVQLVMLEKGL